MAQIMYFVIEYKITLFYLSSYGALISAKLKSLIQICTHIIQVYKMHDYLLFCFQQVIWAKDILLVGLVLGMAHLYTQLSGFNIYYLNLDH